jgi:N-methylhydantoinase A
VSLVDPATERCSTAPVFLRSALRPDDRVAGPAVIREANTSTVVPATFRATVHASGALVLDRTAGGAA